jgi:putative transposase
VVAVDLGEVHPAALSDGAAAAVVSCRELRSVRQYTAKRLAEIASKQAGKKKGSRRWRRLQRRRNRFQAKQRRRARDLEHKTSRAVVTWAAERQAGTIALGDVRQIANGKRLNDASQQKIGLWSHGQQRRYIEYKAQALGITVTLVDEHATTKTCPAPACGASNKPRGRTYVCQQCGFVGHRDVVGAVNIWSRHTHGAPGRCSPPRVAKYLRPFVRKRRSSRPDTAELARRSS